MAEPTTPFTQHQIDALLRDSTPYLSCDDCFERIDVFVEQTLADPAYDDPAMRVHLAACGVCAEEADALRDLISSQPG